jgi:hypothetical protein
MLSEAIQTAKDLAGEGDLLKAGHLTFLIEDAIIHDTSSISIPEAGEIFDGALSLASNSLRDGEFSLMSKYISTGWKLGSMMDLCRENHCGSLLLEQLLKAEEIMKTGLPWETERIIDWCNQTKIMSLANRISSHEEVWQTIEKSVPENSQKTIVSLFSAVKNTFDSRDEESCEKQLVQLQRRLDQLGVQIPEGLVSTAIVTALILFSLVKRRSGPNDY